MTEVDTTPATEEEAAAAAENLPSTTLLDSGVAKIKLGEATFMEVDLVDINKMFAQPAAGNGLAFAAILSRCVIPIQMGVFTIPAKLLDKITTSSIGREVMTPPETMAIRREISIFTVQAGAAIMSLMSPDSSDQFTHEGIKNSEAIANNFLKTVKLFCKQIEEVDNMSNSARAFIRARTMKTKKPAINPAMLTPAIQDFILNMNKQAAGDGGWIFQSIGKSINRIANFLDNEVIMELFGAHNKAEMLTKLEYRITPTQVMLHENLFELVQLLTVINESSAIDNDELNQLFVLCQALNSSLK